MKLIPLLFIFIASLSVFGITCARGKGHLKKTGEVTLKTDYPLVFEIISVSVVPGSTTVHCELRNPGNHDVMLLFHPYHDVEILIHDVSEIKVLQKTLLLRLEIGKDTLIPLAKGTVHAFALNLTRENCIWPESGNYKAILRYANGLPEVERIKVWTGQVESNTFQLEFD